MPTRHKLIPITLFALFYTSVALLAISSDSLWIDEFMTYRYASALNLKQMFLGILNDKVSEVLMPLYISYMCIHEKLFGAGEFSLRAAALPFYVIGMTALTTQVKRRLGFYIPVLIVFGLSPFIWYYLNEARPYTIQIGISAMILAALIRLGEAPDNGDDFGSIQKSEKRWFIFFCVGLLLLSGIGMLSQLWAGAAIISAVVVIPKSRIIGIYRQQKPIIAVTVIGLLCIGIYYLWSLSRGARAAAIEPSGLFSTIYIFYELLGLTGTGPGRFELREHGVISIRPYLPWLIIHSLAIGSVLIAGMIYLLRARQTKAFLAIAACLSLPALLILSAGVFMDFRVLGRHFAPLAVILFLVLCFGIQNLIQMRNRYAVICLSIFTLFQAASCLLVRYGDRHKRDNYKLAATIATESLKSGQAVWWNANPDGAKYYQLPDEKSTADGRWRILQNPTPDELDQSFLPDLVITSKSDIFDNNLVLSQFLKSKGYIERKKIRSFIIWEKPQTP